MSYKDKLCPTCETRSVPQCCRVRFRGAASSSSSTPQEEPLSQPKSETGARPKVKPEKPKDNNCDSSEATNDDDEQDKVRKRRLERFEAQIE